MIIKKISLLIIVIAVALASCKKDAVKTGVSMSANISPSPSQLAGKWQITKVTTYSVDSLGNKSATTTYQQPLSARNYVQFNDSTCTWSSDHYYIFGSSEKFAVPQNILRVSEYGYQIRSSTINLFQWVYGPQGAEGPMTYGENDTATMPTTNSLVIHSVYSYYISNAEVVADTYYTR